MNPNKLIESNNINNFKYFENWINIFLSNSNNFINNNLNNNFILFGKKYNISNKKEEFEFFSDYYSHILITYRYNFKELLPCSNITSDSGWGCMIRSGQMMLAEVLLRSELGRNWRLYKIIKSKNKSYSIAHSKILIKFIDSPRIGHDFSIHRIIQLGLKYNKKPMDWYGPDTISLIIQDLVNLNKYLNLKTYIARDSIIIKDEIYKLCNDTKKEWFKKLFLIIPIRIGINKINSIYNDTLIKLLDLNQSVGIIGGKPNKSLYFIGHNGYNLFYLDPHYQQHTVTVDNCFPKLKDLLSYHCLYPQKINIDSIDPSLSMGFLINNKVEFDLFCDSIDKIKNDGNLFFEIIENKFQNNDYKMNDNNSDDTWDLI